MKAMILAAGMGTRLKSLTAYTPKALVRIKGRTLLEILITRLKSFGIDQLIINVHHFGDQIERYLEDMDYFDINIAVSKEDVLLDTGGGLKKAAWFFDNNEPFLMHNVDVLSDVDISELFKFHQEHNALATLATRKRNTTRYLLIDNDNNLCGWESTISKEKIIKRRTTNSLQRVSFMGIQIISPEFLSLLPGNDNFSIIESYLHHTKNHIIKTVNYDHRRWLDAGKPDDLSRAEILFPEYFVID